MALKNSMELTEMVELFPAEETAFTKGSVQRGSRMSLGKYKAVSVRVLVIFRINVHHIKIQRNHSFRAGQGSARMSCACSGSHDDDVSSHLPCI